MDYTNSGMAWLIDEYIHSERDRMILRRRYLDGITQEAIANEFQMSKRQIQYIDCRFRQSVIGKYFDKLC